MEKKYSKTNERNIVFLSEVSHVSALTQFLEKHSAIAEEGYMIVALDIEIENALKEKGMAFVSGRGYRTPDLAPMVTAEEWVASVFESDRWSFFNYRGVTLSRLYFLPLHWYMSHLIYFADIVSNVFTRHPSVQRFISFGTGVDVPLLGNTLAIRQIHALGDILTSLTKEHNKELLIWNIELPARKIISFRMSFLLKRRVFGISIAILNSAISMFRRKGRVRILASDYWRYLEPYVKRLDSAEVILIDRKEALNAGFKNIWKYRMRFSHIDAFSEAMTKERTSARDRITEEWRSIKKEADFPTFRFKEISLQSICMDALERIIEEVSTKILKDIDGAHMMCEQLKPDLVELKSTISAQTHFIILAQVARERGIPSIEMQHGLEYLGPGSYWRRHSAEFMGVYGPFIKKEMEAEEYQYSKPIVIGSPRFDIYSSIREQIARTPRASAENVHFLCIAPSIDAGGDFDTYEAEEYYQAIAAAVRKVPNAEVIIKFRPGPNKDNLVRPMITSLFEGIPHSIAQFEPLSELFLEADVVISCYSTVALEALAAYKPLILLGLYPTQKMMTLHHFTEYAKRNALRLATTEEQLDYAVTELGGDHLARTKVSDSAANFLNTEYLFDGHASERTAEFIRSMASGKK